MNAKTPLPASIERDDAASTDHIEEELRRYDAYLRDLRGLSPGSRRHALRVAGRLLRQKFGDGVVDIAQLRPADVRQFLAEQLDARRTPSNAATLASGLRSYLRYRRACGDSVDAVTAVISSPAHWRLATLPHALTAEEVEQFLSSFRLARRWPKRGYAIARSGPRHSDGIISSVISWEEKTVNIHGLMPWSCEPAGNRVYSRLLGVRNDQDDGGKPGMLFG
jgi:integrase